jgi:hypothetical protein
MTAFNIAWAIQVVKPLSALWLLTYRRDDGHEEVPSMTTVEQTGTESAEPRAQQTPPWKRHSYSWRDWAQRRVNV